MDTAQTIELSRLRAMVRSGAARGVRLGAHLSLAEVGDAIGGVSPSTILRWERGERSPRGEPALRYWELLRALMETR